MSELVIVVKVIPKASSSEIVGWENEVLKVRIKAIPDKGKANQELIRFLAEICEVPQSSITILSGATSRLKRVRISEYRGIGLPMYLFAHLLKACGESNRSKWSSRN